MTLRTVLLGISYVIVAAALFASVQGWWAATPLAVIGAITMLGVLCERHAYKPAEEEQPGSDWQQTPERFVDPVTSKRVTVFVKPETGERRYVKSQ